MKSYTQLVQEAEKVAGHVQDKELWSIAFNKVLDVLIAEEWSSKQKKCNCGKG